MWIFLYHISSFRTNKVLANFAIFTERKKVTQEMIIIFAWKNSFKMIDTFALQFQFLDYLFFIFIASAPLPPIPSSANFCAKRSLTFLTYWSELECLLAKVIVWSNEDKEVGIVQVLNYCSNPSHHTLSLYWLHNCYKCCETYLPSYKPNILDS